MSRHLVFIFTILSVGVNAKTVTTPKSPVIVTDGTLFEKVCYYEDKAYTLGAVIQVGELYLTCGKEQEFELNGDLRWLQLKQDE
ncbi:YnjH family protein [Vibrio sp. S9_S30]|uniref:YnjH family protein n=1 Tax=Vibrio sp. S9_S30 TaxID=2720226 RepID=UPI001681805A|nr:YnjH family protein [Vibrio sp. S9_S30]MBD1558764.1 YnjH family protein [Vibrio sp. S9_S30]